MKHRALMLILLTVITGCSQQSSNIIKGIRYKEADENTNTKAKELIIEVLTPDYSGVKHIFGTVLMCGPFMSEQKVVMKYVNTTTAIDTGVSIPTNKGVIRKTGKLFQKRDEILGFETYLRNILKEDGSFNIRKLTENELAVYWAVIPYDIEEPVFILESKTYKFLMDFSEDKVFYIDEISEVSIKQE